MINVPDWTTDQWIAFTGATVAGLAALGLLAMALHAVRAWTAPAIYRAADAPTQPRPSLQLAAGRLTGAEMTDLERRWCEEHPHPVVLDERGSSALWMEVTGLDDVTEHLAPGAGSLTSLAETGPGHFGERVELVDPEVASWFADAFDRPAHVPAPDEARVVDLGGVLAQFQAAIEPAMRTARLWRVRGEEGPGVGRRLLNDWRIGTDTGEWPLIRDARMQVDGDTWVFDAALARIP